MASPPETVVIDLSTVGSIEQLHAVLQDRFQFPDFYGRNWDAFWDSITDLVVLPPRIRLAGWENFKSRFPRDAQILQKCFDDYRQLLGENASEVEFM